MVGCDRSNVEIMHMVLDAFPSNPCIINSVLGVEIYEISQVCQSDRLAVAAGQRKQMEEREGKHRQGIKSTAEEEHSQKLNALPLVSSFRKWTPVFVEYHLEVHILCLSCQHVMCAELQVR